MKRKPPAKPTKQPRDLNPRRPVPDHYEPIGNGNYRTPPSRSQY